MDFTWKRTTPEVYRAIYNQHKDDLRCYGSYTEMDTHGEEWKAQITIWCFAGSDIPLIQSELSLGEWRYYIVHDIKDNE